MHIMLKYTGYKHAIDKSTIYIRLHETIVLTMKPKASTNRLQGISSVRKAKNNPSY